MLFSTAQNIERGSDLIELHTPIDFGAALVGAILGVIGALLVIYISRPRVRHKGFSKHEVRTGTMYYLEIRVRGFSGLLPRAPIDPGTGSAHISWRDKSGFCKWNELHEPGEYKDDGTFEFHAELVPSTYFLPLQYSSYQIPILLDPNEGLRARFAEDDRTALDESEFHVYTGWWYGWPKGWQPDPKVSRWEKLQLSVDAGAEIHWSTEVDVNEVIERAS